MTLTATLASLETLADDRRRLRRTLRLEVAVASEGRILDPVVAHNISETGLLVETDAKLSLGEVLSVDLPTGLRSAEVVWSSDGLFGCKFHEEAKASVVSAALLRAPFVPLGTADAAHTALPRMLSGENVRTAEHLEKSDLSLRTRVWVILGLACLSWGAIGVGVLAVL